MTDGAPAKKTRVVRSKSDEATIVRAKAVASALPPLLSGIAEADANAAKVRIDQGWLDAYQELIASAERTADGQPVRLAQREGATSDERTTAQRLVAALASLRDRVATHHTQDVALQRAFGRGTRLHPRQTGTTLAAAGAIANAWTLRRDDAEAAGVTQAQIDEIAALRSTLSGADVAQGVATGRRRDGTIDKKALFALVGERSAYAVRVVGNVFGAASAQARTIEDPRPRTGANVTRASAKSRRAATKKAVRQRKVQLAARPAKAPKKEAATTRRSPKKPAKKKR